MEYNRRGYTKDTSGDYRGALLDYTKAIEIDPNDEDSYYNSGNTKNNLEDNREPVLIQCRDLYQSP